MFHNIAAHESILRKVQSVRRYLCGGGGQQNWNMIRFTGKYGLNGADLNDVIYLHQFRYRFSGMQRESDERETPQPPPCIHLRVAIYSPFLLNYTLHIFPLQYKSTRTVEIITLTLSA